MTDTSTTPAKRVELSHQVASILAQETPEARLGRLFVRFAEALADPDSRRIDDVIATNARFHELEDAGFSPGPEGFKLFRKQINAAFPDEHTVIVAMRFPEENYIETDLDCTATHRGELMGIPASGRSVRFTVHTRNRFEHGRMAERWDSMDFAGLMAQIRG
jgi:predicted ester cyclase